MLGNLQLGVLLYFLQISANLLSASVLWPRLRPAPGATLSPLPADLRPISLPVAISQAMDSCLTVCGCVLFFRVAASSLAAVFPLTGLPFAGVCALLEITSGCQVFAQLGGAASLYGICICLSCLGASVLTQIRQLAGQKLSLGLFTVSRLCNALFLCGEIRLCRRRAGQGHPSAEGAFPGCGRWGRRQNSSLSARFLQNPASAPAV